MTTEPEVLDTWNCGDNGCQPWKGICRYCGKPVATPNREICKSCFKPCASTSPAGLCAKCVDTLANFGKTIPESDDWVSYLRFRNHNGTHPTTIHVCNPDDEGAFKVYRHPVAPPEKREDLLLDKLAQAMMTVELERHFAKTLEDVLLCPYEVNRTYRRLIASGEAQNLLAEIEKSGLMLQEKIEASK